MLKSDVLPPSSAKYLNSLFNSVFLPLKLGQSVNVITFTGAGKWANLNFLSDYAREFDPIYPSTAYVFIDAVQLAFSLEEELQNGLNFMLIRAFAQKNEQLSKLLDSKSKINSVTEFLTIIRSINDIGQRLVFFIDNAEILTRRDRKSQLCVASLTTLEQMHSSQMAFVFITKGEVIGSLSNLGRLEKYFMQKIVKESDIPHDEECVAAYLVRYEKTRQVHFGTIAKKNLVQVAKGMPILSKHLIEKYHVDDEMAQLLNSSPFDIPNLYQHDASYFDKYFESLLLRLSPASKDYLFNISVIPTEYVRAAGLINSDGSPVNELFAYYLKNRGSRYTITTGLESLTSQELRVFHLLVDSLDKTVSREEIARSMWQENWQSKYSEQSIDKTVSNIRAKLRDLPFKITAVKGIGVLVEVLADK